MDEAEILSQHHKLVVSIARKLCFKYRLNQHLDEMIAFGNKGLLDAANRFEVERGVVFSTFAYYRIRGAILDGARSMGWLKRQRRAQYLAEQLFNEHQQARYEDNPASPQSQSLDRLALDLDASVSDAGFLYLLTEHATQVASEADHNLPPDSRFEQEQAFALLRRFIETLPSEERAIIEMTFFQESTTEEIGQRLGCSRSWACRRRQAALEKLKQMWLEAS